MTSIAYKDGILAADGGSCFGDIWVEFDVQKIVRLKDGRYFAAAGPVAIIEAVTAWLNGKGEKPEKQPDQGFGALVVYRTGEVKRIDHLMMPFNSDEKIITEGCHTDLMMGYMLAGKTAVEAVELAVRIGRHAAGKVRWVNVRNDDRG